MNDASQLAVSNSDTRANTTSVIRLFDSFCADNRSFEFNMNRVQWQLDSRAHELICIQLCSH